MTMAVILRWTSRVKLPSPLRITFSFVLLHGPFLLTAYILGEMGLLVVEISSNLPLADRPQYVVQKDIVPPIAYSQVLWLT